MCLLCGFASGTGYIGMPSLSALMHSFNAQACGAGPQSPSMLNNDSA